MNTTAAGQRPVYVELVNIWIDQGQIAETLLQTVEEMPAGAEFQIEFDDIVLNIVRQPKGANGNDN